ncbi:MAG: PLD nuclease N-terminal domain-containing protein [Bacteroidetes bacterium]|nr:PLD nuclease N-terminal domain-containing protein [Bacteroidota bacterium]
MFENLGVAEIILILFVLLPTILWVAALVDILKSNFKGDNKLIWILVVVFLPIIGAVLYFIIGRNKKTAG